MMLLDTDVLIDFALDRRPLAGPCDQSSGGAPRIILRPDSLGAYQFAYPVMGAKPASARASLMWSSTRCRRGAISYPMSASIRLLSTRYT